MRTAQIESLISRVKTKDPVLYEILRSLNLDTRDTGQTVVNVTQTQDQIGVDITALEAAIAALQAALAGLASQGDLDALAALFANHKDRHTSGGADSFVATDLVDALVKRIRSVTADLEIGTITDGEFLKRSGTQITSAIPVTAKRTTAQFDKTNDVMLSNIPGLSVNVVAMRSYSFEACLFVDEDLVGGSQFSMGGSCSASAVIYEVALLDEATKLFATVSRFTSLF